MKTGTSTLLKCLHQPLFDVVWSVYGNKHCLDITWSFLPSQTKVPDEQRLLAQVEINFDLSENKILIWFQSFPAEKAKKKASDKNKKSGFVVNKQARAVEEDEIPNKSKKSSKKAPPPAPKVRTNIRETLQGVFLHTWYLSFFLHKQNFWRIKFTPKKRVNYDKIHRKLPIFCVITAKYTVNCQFFALNL